MEIKLAFYFFKDTKGGITMNDVVYGNKPEKVLRADHRFGTRPTNHFLLGTWLKILSKHGEWIEV